MTSKLCLHVNKVIYLDIYLQEFNAVIIIPVYIPLKVNAKLALALTLLTNYNTYPDGLFIVVTVLHWIKLNWTRLNQCLRC